MKIRIKQIFPNPNGRPFILDEDGNLWEDSSLGRPNEPAEWKVLVLPDIKQSPPQANEGRKE